MRCSVSGTSPTKSIALYTDKRKYQWKKTSSSIFVFKWGGPSLKSEEALGSPVDYLRYFFDQQILEEIVQQSNLYAVQNNPNEPLLLIVMELE